MEKLFRLNMYYIFLPFFALLCVVANFAFAGKAQTENQDDSHRYQNLKIFSNVLSAIENSYAQDISSERLIQGAINGMFKELDPYSHYLPKDQLKQFSKEMKGRFSGLGLELMIKNKHPIVISVLENSPAHKADLRSGQIILRINGKKTIGLNSREVSKLLEGHRGKEFHITVKDPDSKKTHQEKLKSKFISIQSVMSKKIDKGILYLRINVFTERTAQEIRKIMDKYKTQAEGLVGLILDLRENPGGVFDSAVKVADLFIESGTIVSVRGRLKNYEKVIKARFQDTLPDFPMLTLIGAYSASAAEVLAGALKDNKRSLLLGRKSFGKGSVQSLIPIDAENAIKLTVAHYYRPSGKSIHEQGIKPDIKLEKHISSGELKLLRFTEEEDTDFQHALFLLQMIKYFKSNHLVGI